MKYRAVGNRCAVNLESLNLPVTKEVALNLLEQQGFRELKVDIINLACSRLGCSQYRRSARLAEAPG